MWVQPPAAVKCQIPHRQSRPADSNTTQPEAEDPQVRHMLPRPEWHKLLKSILPLCRSETSFSDIAAAIARSVGLSERTRPNLSRQMASSSFRSLCTRAGNFPRSLSSNLLPSHPCHQIRLARLKRVARIHTCK